MVAASAPFDRGEALAMLRDKLPRHMVPSRIEVVRSLPRTASGKLDRLATLGVKGRPVRAGSPSSAGRPCPRLVSAMSWSRHGRADGDRRRRTVTCGGRRAHIRRQS
ncbi:hypothetical protein ACIBQ1_19725 [Nonomuraea sp. NPDC050153]|uniref:hypothetical protein n=1 Tax=Nonomuraea sp. NPDC050153 TaxID=3364359 RepID=UPI0037A90E05